MKTIMLGDFENADNDYLISLISKELGDLGINASSFAFHIEVEYEEVE
tara:strand:+ start:1194 stop:1337 length:144 start_codon:yes stop_codon:yes gene_type:complete